MPSPRETPQAQAKGLILWRQCFELALAVMEMSRRIEGPAARKQSARLMESTTRLVCAIPGARRKSLRTSLALLHDVRVAVEACASSSPAFSTRMPELRARIGSIRALLGTLSSGIPPRSGSPQKGSALLMAILVSASLALLGLLLLRIADAEQRIARRARDRDQVMQAAESGARAVKAWFDAPVSGDPSAGISHHAFLGRFDLRNPAHFVRARRILDIDSNPATSPVLADGTGGRPFYRQGRIVAAGAPHLDLFQKPYREDLAIRFAGEEDGPDIVLEDDPGVVDLIDEINADLFSDQQASGRIARIEIYGPSLSGITGPAGRLGMASVKVTAAKYERLDTSGTVPVVPHGAGVIARAVVRMGLAEIPVGLARGPLEACGDLTSLGKLRARWGRVIAAGDMWLPGHLDELDSAVASSFPYASLRRRIGGPAPGGDLFDWLDDPDDTIEDPWLKILAGGVLRGWESRPDHPFPYNQSVGIDYDHSNIFQRVGGLTCAAFDYGYWKRISLGRMPGDRNLHYFAFDPATGLFRERGAGPPRSVRQWTHGRDGIFFFDTTDGAPPSAANLTPPVLISGGDWHTAGLIYLNARSFGATGAAGLGRVLLPPGEPFDDVDGDLAHGSGEMFVNLRYATSLGSGTTADDILVAPGAVQSAQASSPDGETYRITTSAGRDARGLPLSAPVNVFGVLYNSGDILGEGDALHYGSLIAGGDVVQTMPGPDTPVIYFDERLNSGEWPPAEIAIPRTFVTFWQTSRP